MNKNEIKTAFKKTVNANALNNMNKAQLKKIGKILDKIKL
jgi:hypothetical protein